jgi:hypothetical protein
MNHDKPNLHITQVKIFKVFEFLSQVENNVTPK